MLFIRCIITYSRNSMVIIWVILELSILCFIPFIYNSKINNRLPRSIIYFLRQTFCSSYILYILFMEFFLNKNLINFIYVILIFKIGIPPFHQWVLIICVNINWISLFILMSFIKFNPLIFISFIYKNSIQSFNIIILFILIRIFWRCLGCINENNLRKFIIYSSFTHSSWIIYLLCYSKLTFIYYLIFYSLFLIFLVLSFFENKIILISEFYKLNKFYIFTISFFIIIMIGVGPFLGLILKIFRVIENFLFRDFYVFYILFINNIFIMRIYCHYIFGIYFLESLRIKRFLIRRSEIYFYTSYILFFFIIIITIVYLILDFKLYKL